MAAAMSTLYCLRPMVTFTTLFSATVTGDDSPAVNETPNRKSFQIWVNCQMQETTMIGSAAGSMIEKKMRKNPAPSICAALVSSSGMVTK